MMGKLDKFSNQDGNLVGKCKAFTREDNSRERAQMGKK